MKREVPEQLSAPKVINECCQWILCTTNYLMGEGCRLFNVIDDLNREGLAIDADISLPAKRVIRSLDRII